LGPGESAVIELARSFADSAVVIDDLAGRRCAERSGLRCAGLSGWCLPQKGAGRLPVARPVLERLRNNGMYLSDAVLQRALRFVGE
jgi:predicted nucleic acid-binding protein